MAVPQLNNSGAKRPARRKQVGDYILEKSIGFGSFSTVYEGRHIGTNEKVAVKSINLHRININAKHQANLKQEIDILRKCRHENIVQLLHTYQTSNHIYLIMQFCSGGDLHRFVQKRGAMSEAVAQTFSRQLAAGLSYLHSLKIVHRDLKPQNLLLSEFSESATLRIADFGFARHFNPATMVDTMCGSPLYMAPEILKFNKYDSKVDLWSAGTIIFQMVAREPPFNGSNHIELLKRIENGNRVPFPPLLSEACCDLLSRLLQREPKNRMGWDEFFAHPWLAEPEPSSPAHMGIPDHQNAIHPTPVAQAAVVAALPASQAAVTTAAAVAAVNAIPPRQQPEPVSIPKQPPKEPTPNAAAQDAVMVVRSPPDDFVVIPPADKYTPSANRSSDGGKSTTVTENGQPSSGEYLLANAPVNMSLLRSTYVKQKQIEHNIQAAVAILQVGDLELIKTSPNYSGDAMLIYLRGVDELELAIDDIKTWLKNYYHYLKTRQSSQRNEENQSDIHNHVASSSPTAFASNSNHNQSNSGNGISSDDQFTIDNYADYSNKFRDLLTKALTEYSRYYQRCAAVPQFADSLSFVLNCYNVDEIIFKHAVDMSHKAASDIMLGQLEGVKSRFEQCSVLFEYLSTRKSLSTADKKRIESLVSETKKRISAA